MLYSVSGLIGYCILLYSDSRWWWLSVYPNRSVRSDCLANKSKNIGQEGAYMTTNNVKFAQCMGSFTLLGTCLFLSVPGPVPAAMYSYFLANIRTLGKIINLLSVHT